MRWLIRRVLRKGKGGISYEEDTHFGEVLSIGRAADQAIFLPDLRAALNHATIAALGSGRYKVESLILAGIRVDGQITYTTVVGPGSVVEIGTTKLTLLQPPQDFDAGVEVSQLDKSELEAVVERKRKPTSLGETWLAKRWPSWLMFVLILAFGLVLPAASHFVPPLGKALDAATLPTTKSWNPGELDASHQFFGQDCVRCHQHAFLTVRDTACVTCHSQTRAHADPARFNLPQLGDARCVSCHQDHQGVRGLVRTDQRLCADCHVGLHARTKNASALVDVGDFGTNHPEFRVNLPAWDANGGFAPVVTELAPNLREASGLKFNHLKHLKPDGLNTPNGHRTLTCAECHRPDAAAAKMQPIAFEPMCHECHRLAFDTLAPEREVPHAKVAEIVFMLDEFYANRALEGGYNDLRAPTIVQERRRPGSPPLSQQQQQEALSWARDKSRLVAATLFADKACTTCHTIAPPTAEKPLWQVQPVRVAGTWYADAKFTHAKHTTMTCEDCHGGAPKSETSADLLIPGIDNCRRCHGGASARGKVRSTCIDCHDYHRAGAVLGSKL